MARNKYWVKREDGILERRMDMLNGTYKKRARKIVREGLLPGRNANALSLRYAVLRKAREQLQVDRQQGTKKQRPLLDVMFLLDKARNNSQAWDRVFPKALKVAEDVSVDIEKARVELEKTMTAVRFLQTMHADKLDAEMDDCDKALRAQMLVDRQMKAKN